MKLIDIIKDAFAAEDGTFGDEVRLMSYSGWDSMAHMFFITKLEELYKVELTGDEIATMQTVGDVKRILLSKGVNL